MNWTLFFAGLSAVLLVALALALRRIARQRRRIARSGRRVFKEAKHWPVPLVSARELSPAFALGPWGHTPRSEVRFVAHGEFASVGTISDYESWVLSVFARDARCIFEFGTCTGRTTYLLAVNAPADARVGTLTLDPEQLGEYADADSDSDAARAKALAESVFDEFFYSGTGAEKKIEQLFADSKKFDESRWRGRCDLIFVDGSHARSYVVSDTKKAFRMLAPGGAIFWHDYRGKDHAETADVYHALNALHETLPLAHVAGTSLVVYRHRPEDDERIERALAGWA